MMFVIIDDRVPVRDKDGQPVFGHCKDPNELWVLFMEKAYAKLHGCYKALIGGYTHYGLGDMTGYSPRLIVLKEGIPGYSQAFTTEEVWELLKKYSRWDSLMGCSIQANPKDNVRPEAEAGGGLHIGHAYSLLQVGEIPAALSANANAAGGNAGGNSNKSGNDSTIRLLKLRNPWGSGEWDGAFSDDTPERAEYDEAIKRAFTGEGTKEANSRDGTFFMKLEDWIERFTNIFVAVRFPDGQRVQTNAGALAGLTPPKNAPKAHAALSALHPPSKWFGKRIQGEWRSDLGGNRKMGTWISNPKVKFILESPTSSAQGQGGAGQGGAVSAGGGNGQEEVEVFAGLYIRDARLSMGVDYYKVSLNRITVPAVVSSFGRISTA
jgi:hypothetical protein